MPQNNESTSITFDEGDTDEALYAYGRPYTKGPQQGFILRATSKQWPDGGRQIDLVLGIGCPTIEGKGVKVDYRVRIPSPEYGDLLRLMDEKPVKGQSINLEAWKNREVPVNIGEEVDRKKSEESGQKVLRATCLCLGETPRPAPATVPPPPAAKPAAKQPAPPAFS